MSISSMIPEEFRSPGAKKSTQERIDVLRERFFGNTSEALKIDAFLADLLNLAKSGSTSREVVIETGTFKMLSPESKKRIEGALDDLVRAAEVELTL